MTDDDFAFNLNARDLLAGAIIEGLPGVRLSRGEARQAADAILASPAIDAIVAERVEAAKAEAHQGALTRLRSAAPPNDFGAAGPGGIDPDAQAR